MTIIVLSATAVGVYAFMLAEARRAAANETVQRARGAIEPAGDVYRWMQFAYPGIFAAMLAEGLWSDPLSPLALIAGATIFVLAKALKWWAILTLGPYWTFRVLVVPGSTPVARGPYAFLRHPNYVGVLGEIVGVALLTGARVTGPLSMVVFGSLLLRRVAIEQRARDAILPRT